MHGFVVYQSDQYGYDELYPARVKCQLEQFVSLISSNAQRVPSADLQIESFSH